MSGEPTFEELLNREAVLLQQESAAQAANAARAAEVRRQQATEQQSSQRELQKVWEMTIREKNLVLNALTRTKVVEDMAIRYSRIRGGPSLGKMVGNASAIEYVLPGWEMTRDVTRHQDDENHSISFYGRGLALLSGGQVAAFRSVVGPYNREGSDIRRVGFFRKLPAYPGGVIPMDKSQAAYNSSIEYGSTTTSLHEIRRGLARLSVKHGITV